MEEAEVEAEVNLEDDALGFDDEKDATSAFWTPIEQIPNAASLLLALIRHSGSYRSKNAPISMDNLIHDCEADVPAGHRLATAFNP